MNAIVARQEAAVQPDRQGLTTQKGIVFSGALRVDVQMGLAGVA